MKTRANKRTHHTARDGDEAKNLTKYQLYAKAHTNHHSNTYEYESNASDKEKEKQQKTASNNDDVPAAE